MDEPKRQAAITAVYDALHKDKLGAHWLWCVIEKIAAGQSEDEAMDEFGYFRRAAVEAAQPEVVGEHAPCKGTNCGITRTGQTHSPECYAEHEAACKVDPLDTAGNRHREFRYAGYKGQPLKTGCNADQAAAYREGVLAAAPTPTESQPAEADERSEREAFEAWMRSIGKTDRDLQCDGWNSTGEYSWITERSMWAAWQARALSAPTAPAPTEPVAWGIIARNTGRMCQVTLDKSEIEDHNPAHIVPLVRATPPKAAAQPEVVGWKLVPIEPTPAMWTAGGRAIKGCGGHERDAASLAYTAMLAAAPTTEATSSPSDAERLDAARYRWLRRADAPFDVWTDDSDGFIAHSETLDAAIDAAILATKGGEI